MRRECYVFCILFALCITATMASHKEASGGLIANGLNPIKNLNDPHVVDIAQFAVTDYNKQSAAHLKLVKINNGYTQVVSGGVNYNLLLLTFGGLPDNRYEAIVFENNSQNSRKLISFHPLHD
ncbi:hypothetical protein HN51_002854 [Arachis hypogaea]|uniref:Cystatin domain-containing protein n=3 Tax=Arachis TaxID=3817 RepID=A0A445EKY7_ARAHY|nr:cysteine proteinase inhibitor 1-like [Arachis duranensis]QHO51103.1 Putative cysteine proteinase inhibitor [Arachis hypogaea]RYR76115.1 hypothetical protein Ahy_A01g000711 [Arachis hypogaea]